VRAAIDASSEKLGAKIRSAQLDKIPLMAILGKREAEAGQVSVRSRQNGDEGSVPINEFLERLKNECQIAERPA
jgi:threonyl-tRNA synthetase